ncbi:hypothetical protein WJX74_011081 [Apatococcus lobatus]|uniref:Hydroxyproline O-arabinosyltransferase-like domain-containing protein n=2 Tax=Apatococcus TaxID=904362 RepID=A0AAW1T682_9CHLO
MKRRTVIMITGLLALAITSLNFFSGPRTNKDEPMHGKLAQEIQEGEVGRVQAELDRQQQRQKQIDTQNRRLKLGEQASPMTQEASPKVDQPLKEQQRQQQQRSTASVTANTNFVENKYHVVTSVDGQIYTEWQVRIHYYWYKQMRLQYPDSAMGGFTRLLHSGKPDFLMDEIPTKVVDLLPPGMDKGFVVLNRPYAFAQWVERYMASIPERYVLMSEPDHLFIRPPPLWATLEKPAAFVFTYIEPAEHATIVNRFNDRKVPVESMAQIGSSPVIINRDQLAAVVDAWYDISLRLKNDPEADKAFGWVLDMYGWSIASSQHPDGPLQYDLHLLEFMIQPPWDETLAQGPSKENTTILHYTYGSDFNLTTGKFTPGTVGQWHWDKRDFSTRYPDGNIDCPAIIQPQTTHLQMWYINQAIAALGSAWGRPAVSR